VRTQIDFGYEGFTITQSQDAKPFLEFAETLRNKKESVHTERWNHYAIIPVPIQVEMHKAGINPTRDPKAAFQYINKYHPEYKVTNLWHDSPRAGRRDTRIRIKTE
jgi:hypothetical protein